MKYSKKIFDEVIAMYKDGWLVTEIAEATGVCKHTVCRWANDNGLRRLKERHHKETQDQQVTPKTNATYNKPLCECHPREIFAYLRTLGYKGELRFTQKIEI